MTKMDRVNYPKRKEKNSSCYECFSKFTESICKDIVVISGLLKNPMDINHKELMRIKKIEREIELISEHKRQCKDYLTLKRMEKTIKYLTKLMSEPDAVYK